MYSDDEFNYNLIYGDQPDNGEDAEGNEEPETVKAEETATEKPVPEEPVEEFANVNEEVSEERVENPVFADATVKTNNITQGQEHKKEKKHGKWKSGFKLVGMATAFGIIAGVVFYGVNFAADSIFKTNVVVPTDTLKEAETSGIVVNKSDTVSTYGKTMVMDVSDVVENAMPSAVAITGTTTVSNIYGFNPFFNNTYESPVSGSGIIIGQNDTELLIVTNAHVVENVNGITVTFIDNTTAQAAVKGMKSNRDIAVIAVNLSDLSAETLSNISIIKIGDSESVKMGQPVIAIGNALGEGQSSTVGWISALDRTITIDNKEYPDLIMTDAAINPGNSGGALLNTDGELIGINSAKYTDEDVEGMGYAIPISAVADIINNLMTKEVREKVDPEKIGYMGISGMDITSSISKSYNWPEGIALVKVESGSPADQAGLLKNDILVGFDGEDIDSYDELRALLEYYAEGETVTIDFYRIENGEYELRSTQLTLGKRN